MAPPPDPTWRGSPAKHRAIMAAAGRVFTRAGFTRASVDAIAAEAGVSPNATNLTTTSWTRSGCSWPWCSPRSSPSRASSAWRWTRRSATPTTWSATWSRSPAAGSGCSCARMPPPCAGSVLAEAPHHPPAAHRLGRGGPPACQPQAHPRPRPPVGARQARHPRPGPPPAEQLALLVTTPASNRALLGTVTLSDAEVDEIVEPNVRMFLRAYAPGRRAARVTATRTNQKEMADGVPALRVVEGGSYADWEAVYADNAEAVYRLVYRQGRQPAGRPRT